MRFIIQPYHAAASWTYFVDLSTPPTAVDDTDTVDQNTPITVNVLANDTHPIAGATLIVTEASVPNIQGTVVIEPDYRITYTPFLDFVGVAVISYTVADENGDTALGVLRITVTEPNFSPVAVADTDTVVQNQTLVIDPRTNDTHAGGESMTITDASLQTGQGTVTFTGTQITYTPTITFAGEAAINYTITDENGDTASSTITVTVTADGVPTPTDDAVVTVEETPVVISPLTNDTHEDADTMTVVNASVSALEGTVTFTSTTVTFTPAVGFTGLATVSYTVEDSNQDQQSANITVTVQPEPVPTANPDTATTPYETAIDVNVVNNDTHPTPDALTVVNTTLASGSGTVAIVSNQIRFTPGSGYSGNAVINYTIEDANGDQALSTLTVTVEADPVPTAVDDTASTAQDTLINIAVLSNDTHSGTDTLSIASATVLTGGGSVAIIGTQLQYTPAAGYSGTATIEYVVEDENGSQDTGLVTVTITTDPTPSATPDTGTTDENQAVILYPLTNDTHATDPLTIVAASVAAPEGSVTFTGSDITYTPATSFTGTATINYTIEDSNGDQDSSTVTVTVTNVNPVAVNDTTTTVENTPVAFNVIANDSHLYGEALTVVAATVAPAEGSLSFTASTITFTPATDFVGTATVNYTIEDPDGDQDTGILTITVTADPAPTANTDTGSMDQDTTATFDVLANDTHPTGGETLTIVSASADNGTASIVSNQIEYTPGAGWTGTATITYTVEDTNGDQDTSTLTVTVNAVSGYDPLDEPTSYSFIKFNGSGSGVSASSGAVWSSKEGYTGASNGVELRSSTSSGETHYTVFDDPIGGQVNTFRARFKVKEGFSGKAYMLCEPIYMNPTWQVVFDITNDATPDSSRVISSTGVTQVAAAMHPSYPGWVFVKWEVDLTSASDTAGEMDWHMSDNTSGKGLGSGLHVVFSEDFTWGTVG